MKDNIKFLYTVCFHLADYEEFDMRFSNPLSIGDHISSRVGDEEFIITDIIHYEDDLSFAHCKSVPND